MNPLSEELLVSLLPQNTLETMKAFNASHVEYVLSQIPLSLTVTSTLPVLDGYARSTTASATLAGSANAIDTRRVLVNGVDTKWLPWQGTWSSEDIRLFPGINR